MKYDENVKPSNSNLEQHKKHNIQYYLEKIKMSFNSKQHNYI